MDLNEYTKEVILDDLVRLDYLNGLKRELRYNQHRNEVIQTESVAEHVYGMHMLALYFLPLEDPENKMSTHRIFGMITLHDTDEIETGDIIGYKKTKVQEQAERLAQKAVTENSPKIMHNTMSSLLDEYDAQTTPEALFVKAIDKLEPIVHVFNEDVRNVLKNLKTTAEDSLRIKEVYVKRFPYMNKFCKFSHQHLVDSGYFYTE